MHARPFKNEEVLRRFVHERANGTEQAVKRVWIPKPGSNEKRPLGVPTLRDRIVQGALLHVMEPIFERDFAPQELRVPSWERMQGRTTPSQ
jgi:RNA-directed DNA polymerase